MEKTGYSEWGVHAVLDCGGCDIEKISNRANIEAFTKYLVNKIDMVAYGDPIIEHFATHDPTKGGFTLLQMIETSAIAAHFVEATGEAYFDVFSCKDFDLDVVTACIQGFFNPTRIERTMLSRGINYSKPIGIHEFLTTSSFNQSKAKEAAELYDQIKNLLEEYQKFGYEKYDHYSADLQLTNTDFKLKVYTFNKNTSIGKEFIDQSYRLAKLDIVRKIQNANDALIKLGFEPITISELMIQDTMK